MRGLDAEVQQAQASLEAMLAGGARPAGVTPAVGVRASQRVDTLRGALQQWFAFYNGYDPAFTERVPAAYQPVAKALTAYSTLLRQKMAGLPARRPPWRPAPAWAAAGAAGEAARPRDGVRRR